MNNKVKKLILDLARRVPPNEFCRILEEHNGEHVKDTDSLSIFLDSYDPGDSPQLLLSLRERLKRLQYRLSYSGPISADTMERIFDNLTCINLTLARIETLAIGEDPDESA